MLKPLQNAVITDNSQLFSIGTFVWKLTFPAKGENISDKHEVIFKSRKSVKMEISTLIYFINFVVILSGSK
jgi:hypothetical protein